MNKLSLKRIIGLFIFALTIMSLGVKTVSAKTCDEVRKIFNQNETPARYGLTIDYDRTKNKYIIKEKIDKDALKKLTGLKSSDLKFKLVGVYFYEPVTATDADLKDKDGNVTLAGTEDISSKIDAFVKNGIISDITLVDSGIGIKISNKIMNYRSNSEFAGIAVKLVPDGFNDPELVSTCGENAKFEVILNTYVEMGQDAAPGVYTSSTSNTSSLSYGKINCDNYKTDYAKDSFNYNFCEDKTNALKNSSTRKFTIREYIKGNMIKYENNEDSKKIGANDALAYKCNYTDLVQGVKEGNDYYINKSYLHGEGTIKISLDNGYKYTGDGNYTANSANLDASCELKCEEVVKVEYGPPVASKAGLCFEYKVKVTSRVNCEMTKEPTPPPQQVSCTPTPVCVHKNGKIYTQAGPNEDFDKCIKSCDGGKYTDKCSIKCYKQVYGNSIARQKTFGSQVAANGDVLYEYKYRNGELIWDVGTDLNRYFSDTNTVIDKYCGFYVKRDSYYNKINKWGTCKHYYPIYKPQGIPSVSDCSADCYWKLNESAECQDESKLRYLNDPGVYEGTDNKSKLESDMEFNSQQYEKLVKQCSAYAACNTTTAEYTISVDYTKKGTGTKQTVYFPYTSNNDKNTKDTITNKDSLASCPSSDYSIILSSDGCYNCSKVNEKKMYMTEWSFPGTWINNKTGKITYTPVTTTAWRKMPEKFCLPLDADNVNAKWYNYYQAKVNGNNNDYSYNTPDYITNITCPDGTKVTNVCDYKNTKFTAKDAEGIDYNINATTRNFGMFEWDIDISCFYALNDIFPKEKESDNCDMPTCTDDKTDMRIRSVDLSNLFPDADGNKLTDTSKTGRTPGFNWTSFADQTEKDEKFASTPSNYAQWIQAKGAGVYSDQYLDYEVNLTKELIAKIKKTDKEYTNWEGEVETNSVNNYQSPLFRNGGILAGVSKYPSAQALQCNNIGAHTPSANYSAQCEDFSGEVK